MSVLLVPSPLLSVTERRLACLGRQEFVHVWQFERKLVRRNHVWHAFLVINREWLAPVALTREDGVAETVVHLHAAYVVLGYVFLGCGNGFLDGKAVEREVDVRLHARTW